MDGDLYVHPGKTGPWTFMIFRTKAPEGGYSASAEISFDGRQQCKLVLSVPELSRTAGDEMIKRKCIDWIEQAELTGARSI
ncbi:hypothetical protein [Variovorax sp. W6]|uniref:hypothetical protein n=1 Tax=Variovorax sp. W6 TaxID=3093895 RepID=UPI003D807EB3